ncbi:transglycosylase SLT domain-containing protein [Flavobacterium sp.]|uniref:lytic transglycosylase domain-containing protein n=1 Tax=Flavobacterium sp. TaxID=239 RepID=UPI003529B9F5
MKKLVLVLFFTVSFFSFSQETIEKETAMELPKMSYLDSLKATFINHKTSNCIDERWMAELSNEDIFEEMYVDVTESYIDSLGNVTYNLPSYILKRRLAKLDAKSPISIEYTPALENVIKAFLKNRKTSFERLMAISEYYFPMFEEHLSKYDVPLEIKYLAIVESALNPKARSRVGATGLWQFMYPTGKQFNLEVTSYVDERYDPLKATEAACQYLSSLYDIFGDWNLALASYNAGPGNVSKAIRRSGGSQNYWNIRKNLPRETANYVPAFLATMYIFEYKNEHGIVPKKAPITYFETDTIAVKKEITFEQISDLLDIPIEQIEFLNPIYKIKTIPFTTDKPHYLRLPKDKLGLFVSNEEKVYAYADYLSKQKEQIQVTNVMAKTKTKRVDEIVKYHKIRRGETIGGISQKYGVSLSDIRKWNNLRGNTIHAGKTLKVYTTSHNVSTTTNYTSKTKTYRVKKGDSLYTIAKKFPGVSANDIKKWNDISGTKISPGMNLKIKI